MVLLDKINNLINLVNLILYLKNNLINTTEFDISSLVNLDVLELYLENNYIDNNRFEIMLSNFVLIDSVVLEIVLNNIVNIS